MINQPRINLFETYSITFDLNNCDRTDSMLAKEEANLNANLEFASKDSHFTIAVTISSIKLTPTSQ